MNKQIYELIGDLFRKPINEVSEVLKKHGMTYRVFEEDGEKFDLSIKYVHNRINLFVINGLVTDIDVG